MIDILYLNITNKDWFELSLKTIKSHTSNYNNIYVLKTNQDLSQFEDILVCNETFSQFIKRKDLAQKILIIEQNMGILKNINLENIPITYELKDNIYIQDHIKPQLIEKEKILNLQLQQNQNILSQYYKSINRIGIPNNSFVVKVIKPVCCTIKSLLTVKQYVLWNQKGFESLKKYLNSK